MKVDVFGSLLEYINIQFKMVLWKYTKYKQTEIAITSSEMLSKVIIRRKLKVVMYAHMAHFASFWCNDDVMTGTGSHVFLRWETADQWEKGIAGSCNRKSRVLGWETAD